MFKFLVKVVIVVLALQSGMSYLKKNQILVGSIKINYPVLKEKLIKLIPTEKLAAKLPDVVNTKINQAIQTNSGQKHDDTSQTEPGSFNEYQKFRLVIHVVAQGETLSDLSQVYGISSQVIQKINNLQNDDKLTVGQEVKIPIRSRDLT